MVASARTRRSYAFTRTVSVRTAGAAAAGGVVVRGLARDDLRVLDLEPGLLEPVQVVDRRAAQIRRAERVDDDGDPVRIELVVALLGPRVEPERVLEARAAAALDGDPQDGRVGVRLVAHQLPDLGRRGLGQRDDGVRTLDDLHAGHGTRLSPGCRSGR